MNVYVSDDDNGNIIKKEMQMNIYLFNILSIQRESKYLVWPNNLFIK